ncbi:MAG: hypothetical protein MUF31_15950 [Akkermansiaceae bacterium]|jgi:hypothetical protein|nr:hypothetical protein [Akkermansiaceae bacterium]
MKKVLQILAAVAAACSAVAGLDLAGILDILPEQVAPWVAVAPPVAAALFHAAIAIGDILDDGERNDSFGKLPLLLFTLGLAFLVLPSCSVVASAITGQPIAADSVVRVDDPTSEPILIASDDLLRAEDASERARESGNPPPIHGLYDAGWAVARAREVINSK